MGRVKNPPPQEAPPSEIQATMIHRYSQARQVVRITRGAPGWFDVGWPLCVGERVRSTGYGTGKLRDWRLDLQDLRWLRDEPEYQPPAWPERKARPRKHAATSIDDRQLGLFAKAA